MHGLTSLGWQDAVTELLLGNTMLGGAESKVYITLNGAARSLLSLGGLHLP